MGSPSPASESSPAVLVPSPPEERPGRLLALALVLYAVSGATGLVYEVALTRRLLLLLGSTSAASAIVLSAFLGGLAVGGALGGRWAERVRRPLVLYGVLEVAAALWVLLVPLLLAGAEGPYVSIAKSLVPSARFGLRILVAAIAVLPAAILVGATFPAVLSAVSRKDRPIGAIASALYGLNTLGAVAGALWAGFAGVFDHGVSGALRIAGGIAAGVGVLAAVFGRSVLREPVVKPATGPAVPWGPLAVTALCGFVALALEASGVRILVFFVEGFTASFAAMLAVFLAGLAAGSLLLGPLLARAARRIAPSAVVGALLALAGISVVLLAKSLPAAEGFARDARAWAYAGRVGPAEIAAGQRLAALAGSTFLFLVPALLLGATFPLAVLWARGDAKGGERREDVGRVAGKVALWNGVGAVLGPLAVLSVGRVGGKGADPGGPLLSWTVLGLLAAVLGFGLLAFSVRSKRTALALAACLGIAAGFAVPATISGASPKALVSASHVLSEASARPGQRRTLVDARADEVVTASVVESPGERSLYTDDFQAAATGGHYPYMRLLGHLPALAAASDENALVIAFGTGTTAGAVAAHSGVRRLEIAEVSRAVLDLAPHFAASNRGVLSDPRTIVRVDDGREVLLLHRPDLDVITLEPLLPYTPAALPFYTRDFYRLARERLRDGGVLCQWVPVHAMPLDLYQALVATFFREFPDGSLWFFEQSTVLLGRKGTAAPGAPAIQARAAEIERPLKAAGITSPEGIALGFVAHGKRVLKAIEDAPAGDLSLRAVTDDDPFPEAYPTPRGRYKRAYPPPLVATLQWLSSLVDVSEDVTAVPELRLVSLDRLPPMRVATQKALEARTFEAAADFLMGTARPGSPEAAQGMDALSQADALYEEATSTGGSVDRSLRRRFVRCRRVLSMAVARSTLSRADVLERGGDPAGAATAREEALARVRAAWEFEAVLEPVATERPAVAALLAEILVRLGRCAEAEDLLSQAVALWRQDVEVADALAAVRSRRQGVAVTLSPGAAAFAARLGGDPPAPPCRAEPLKSVAADLADYARELTAASVGGMRVVSARLRAAVAAGRAPAAEVAAAVRAMGEGGAPAPNAEKAALVRALDPADPGIASLLASDDEPTWRAALAAAAHLGFRALGVLEVVKARFTEAAHPSRRLALCDAALVDGSNEALGLLADFLSDADPEVRARAWNRFTAILPEDVKREAAYDASAPAERRAASADKVRAWIASRPGR